MNSWYDKLIWRWSELRERWGVADQAAVLPLLFLLLFLLVLVLGWRWSREPPTFAVPTAGMEQARPGQVLISTLHNVGLVLTEKPGGYVRNDLLPPGLLLDNMSAWERGVLDQVRELTHVLYQGGGKHVRWVKESDLAEAERAFSVESESWVMPAVERDLARGGIALQHYAERLGRGGEGVLPPQEAHLQQWLGDVAARLNHMSARLNAASPAHSVLAKDEDAAAGMSLLPETSWWQIDDVFYEARGSAWALLHLLKAVELEFGALLSQRHAELSLRAAIHELEATQQSIWSPVILNGSGFGLFANHSLVMANYLHRAQSDITDVQMLLQAYR